MLLSTDVNCGGTMCVYTCTCPYSVVLSPSGLSHEMHRNLRGLEGKATTVM